MATVTKSIHKGEEEHARLVWVSNKREREMFESERGEEVWEGTSREEGGNTQMIKKKEK